MKRPFLLILLIATILLVVLGPGRGAASAQDGSPGLPAGLFVARVYYDRVEDLQELASYDLWEYNDLDEQYVLVSLDQATYRRLQQRGWRLEVEADQTARLSAAYSPFSDGYRTVKSLYKRLSQLKRENPELIEVTTYGQSACLAQGGCETPGGDVLPGFNLVALRVTNESLPGSSQVHEGHVARGTKPVFFVLANIHARELATSELTLRLVDYLLEQYGRDPMVTYLVDWHEIWIVPTANPDGHWLVELGAQPAYHQGAFYQRKNAQQDADEDGVVDCVVWPPQSVWQFGVDLNRNHSYLWGGPGASSAACDQTYHGPAPASTPEVSALQSLVTSLIADQRGNSPSAPAPLTTSGLLLTLHSFGDLVLWPWGGTDQSAPNHDGLQAIGDHLALLNGYTSCQASLCLYFASGTTDDWAYGELGIPAFTFEIGQYFIPDYQEIEQVLWPKNRPALLYGARLALAPYEAIQGPDVSAIQSLDQGDMFKITALVDDRGHGGEPIASTSYTIDLPYWVEGAQAEPMTAVDGSFDTSTEMVAASIPFSDLGPGRHILYIMGTDTSGQRGLLSAAFISVDSADAQVAYFPLLTN